MIEPQSFIPYCLFQDGLNNPDPIPIITCLYRN